VNEYSFRTSRSGLRMLDAGDPPTHTETPSG
jgi:hypothetical protein